MGTWGRRASAVLVAAVVLGFVVASAPLAAPAPAVPAPYDGPLWTAPDPAVPLWEDPGAAGRAITCDAPVLGWTSTTPFTGGEVGETPDLALSEARDERSWDGLDMQVVRQEPDRVLYTYAAGGRTLQAAVVHLGPAVEGTGAGPDGIAWWVESFARCDIAEYPLGVAESRGFEVWTDPGGRRVSTRVVSSRTGGDCLTGGIRILELGRGDPAGPERTYLAHPESYPEAVREPYREGVALPADATDTGYLHGREHLWLSADQERAYVGDADRVDLWPRGRDVPACG